MSKNHILQASILLKYLYNLYDLLYSILFKILHLNGCHLAYLTLLSVSE